MRIREKELLRQQEEIREECAEIQDFKEACQRMISARKKLDYVEKIIREKFLYYYRLRFGTKRFFSKNQLIRNYSYIVISIRNKDRQTL